MICQLKELKTLRLDVATLRLPFFTLNGGECEPFVYRDDRSKAEIKIMVTNGVGRPSVLDRDVLTYCQSLIKEYFSREGYDAMDKDHYPEIVFSLRDYAEATGRQINGHVAEHLEHALERLATVTIMSHNVVVDGEELASHCVHIIDSYKIPKKHERERGRGKNLTVRVRLASWVWRAMRRDFIRLDPVFFSIKQALARRLAEIGSVYVGTRKSHSFDLVELYQLIGSPVPPRKLLPMIKAQAPELAKVGLSLTIKGDIATFSRVGVSSKKQEARELTPDEKAIADRAGVDYAGYDKLTSEDIAHILEATSGESCGP